MDATEIKSKKLRSLFRTLYDEEKVTRLWNAMVALKKIVHDNRNQIHWCPICNGNIKDRKVALHRELVEELYKVYRWCGEKGVHEFSMSDIKHLLSQSGYSRFNNLTRFGGLVYRPEDNLHKNSGKYGMNMGRTRAFFRGEYKIPIQIVIDQITDERKASTYVSVHDIKGIYTMLRRDGSYDYEKQVSVKVDYEKQKERGIPSVEEYLKNGGDVEQNKML